MARRKQVAPMQRINSGEIMQSLPDTPEKRAAYSHANGHLSSSPSTSSHSLNRTPISMRPRAGILQLLICVGGIYASFLTWGLLQERITTTAYVPESKSLRGLAEGQAKEYWRFPVVLNMIQAFCACVSGGIYLLATTATKSSGISRQPYLPSLDTMGPLFLVALTSTLASPFGYASLEHVDYLTFVLAKSCKLLPVMFLHVVLYRKRYPWSKYAIVLAVTVGVAVFTIYHPAKPGSEKKKGREGGSSYYGLALLAVNLLFDGLTNTTQDRIFAAGKGKGMGRVTSAQMMCVTNLFAFAMMTAYLLVTPHVPESLLPPFARPSADAASSTHELASAMAFLSRHPQVLNDVLGFCICGAVGQLFIFMTLERFSSLLLVTVTVTRKMLTMLLSVVWYGKKLSGGQWVGVALVFAGVGVEAWLKGREKKERGKQEGKMQGKER